MCFTTASAVKTLRCVKHICVCVCVHVKRVCACVCVCVCAYVLFCVCVTKPGMFCFVCEVTCKCVHFSHATHTYEHGQTHTPKDMDCLHLALQLALQIYSPGTNFPEHVGPANGNRTGRKKERTTKKKGHYSLRRRPPPSPRACQRDSYWQTYTPTKTLHLRWGGGCHALLLLSSLPRRPLRPQRASCGPPQTR